MTSIAIEQMDYTPRHMKSGVVFWVRGVSGEELEACVYPSPERGFWYRFYECSGGDSPRVEVWHYGDLSPVKSISSNGEFEEFRGMSRAALCGLAGVLAAEEVDLTALSDMSSEDRVTLSRRATRWGEKITWL